MNDSQIFSGQNIRNANTLVVESVQDFLVKLDMKPCIHLVEISIFSINHIIVRLTKIMNNLIKESINSDFKSHFSVLNECAQSLLALFIISVSGRAKIKLYFYHSSKLYFGLNDQPEIQILNRL